MPAESNLSQYNLDQSAMSRNDNTFFGLINRFTGWLSGDNQRVQQDYINNLNRQWQLEDWQRQADYNSPLQQKQRMLEAGYNPHLAMNNGYEGTTPAAGTAEAPNSPSPSGLISKFSGPLAVMEQFIRIKREEAALTSQEITNGYLSDKLGLENEGRRLSNLTKEQRNLALEIGNSFLHTLLSEKTHGLFIDNTNKHKISAILDEKTKQELTNTEQGRVILADYKIGLMDGIAELISYGLDNKQIEQVLIAANLNPKDYVNPRLNDWYNMERSLDRSEIGAAKAEAELSKILSEVGLTEGDPLYQRLMAVKGVGSTGQTAAAVTDKIISTAISIFRGGNSNVVEGVKNSFENRKKRNPIGFRR